MSCYFETHKSINQDFFCILKIIKWISRWLLHNVQVLYNFAIMIKPEQALEWVTYTQD